MQNKHSVF